MGQAEIKILVILTGLVILIFVIGTIFFLFQYRRKQVDFLEEKNALHEQHLVDILNTKLESQRQTMEYIGHEIHDSVAQKVTLASIYTQRMEFESTIKSDKEKLSSINRILTDSLVELRQLSKDLTNEKLQHSTLAELLQSACDQVNATAICKALLECGELPPLDAPVKNSLLRIAQECIQNSIKHSQCTTIRISLSEHSSLLLLSISDDGKGFAVDQPVSQGIGLNSIRRRVQLLNGKYDCTSSPGRGTYFTFTVPIGNQL